MHIYFLESLRNKSTKIKNDQEKFKSLLRKSVWEAKSNLNSVEKYAAECSKNIELWLVWPYEYYTTYEYNKYFCSPYPVEHVYLSLVVSVHPRTLPANSWEHHSSDKDVLRNIFLQRFQRKPGRTNKTADILIDRWARTSHLPS